MAVVNMGMNLQIQDNARNFVTEKLLYFQEIIFSMELVCYAQRERSCE
jgi:hypothetical protein